MQRHPLNTILGRPALHLLLALGFVVAFCWPILALTSATQTFHFLYVSWIIALVALFAISRGAATDPAEPPAPGEDQANGSDDTAAEITRESL